MRYQFETDESHFTLREEDLNAKEIKKVIEEKMDIPITLKEAGEMADKMLALNNSINTLYEQAVLEAKRTSATADGEPVNKKWEEDANDLWNIRIIAVDLDCAYDEFLFRFGDNVILPNSCCTVEVVTKEAAKENDMDWIKGTPELTKEDIKHYKVGEILSDYRKLGSSKYYFKFM